MQRFAKPPRLTASRGFKSHLLRLIGEVAEWANALVLKTRVAARLPWVRIPPSPPMRIIFTKHAKDMLSQRKIEKELVEKTVRKADYKLEGKYDKKVYLKKFKKNYLKVIVSEEENELYVITLYWLSPKRLRKEEIL